MMRYVFSCEQNDVLKELMSIHGCDMTQITKHFNNKFKKSVKREKRQLEKQCMKLDPTFGVIYTKKNYTPQEKKQVQALDKEFKFKKLVGEELGDRVTYIFNKFNEGMSEGMQRTYHGIDNCLKTIEKEKKNGQFTNTESSKIQNERYILELDSKYPHLKGKEKLETIVNQFNEGKVGKARRSLHTIKKYLKHARKAAREEQTTQRKSFVNPPYIKNYSLDEKRVISDLDDKCKIMGLAKDPDALISSEDPAFNFISSEFNKGSNTKNRTDLSLKRLLHRIRNEKKEILNQQKKLSTGPTKYFTQGSDQDLNHEHLLGMNYSYKTVEDFFVIDQDWVSDDIFTELDKIEQKRMGEGNKADNERTTSYGAVKNLCGTIRKEDQDDHTAEKAISYSNSKAYSIKHTKSDKRYPEFLDFLFDDSDDDQLNNSKSNENDIKNMISLHFEDESYKSAIYQKLRSELSNDSSLIDFLFRDDYKVNEHKEVSSGRETNFVERALGKPVKKLKTEKDTSLKGEENAYIENSFFRINNKTIHNNKVITENSINPKN